MINQQTISTISDLRFKTKEVMKKVSKEPVFLFHRSSPQGVLMSMEKYNEMQSLLEDYYLALRAAEYEKEKKNKVDWLSHSEVGKLINE